MARRAPKSLRPTVASAAGLLAVALVAVLLLPLGTTVSSTVHAQFHVPQGPASATEPRTGSVAPPATAHRGSTRELPDSAPVNPSAGSLFRTVFPNYNTTTSFNFPGTVWDWQVGTPAFIPSTNSLWLPTRAVPAVGGPLPLIAPVVVYSETLETFTGVVPSVQNSSALLYDPSNGLVYSAESFNNTVVAVSASSGGWVQTFPVGTDPTALALDPHSSLLYVANTGSTNLTAINCSTSMIWNSSIMTGPSPRALAFDPFNQQLFVADGGDPWIYDVNTTTNASAKYAAVAPNPLDLAFSASGQWLAVTSSSGSRVTFLNTTLPIPATVNIGVTGAGPVEANGSGPDFVIGISTGSSIVEVNATSATVVASGIPVGTDVTQLAPDPANLGVIAWGAADRNLTVVNLISEKPVMSSSTLGPEPASIAYDPGTNR
ncbi:MAG TPA: YncE family protein, partial [Thermoplasmata archaeon]|nr:YncE family protein [Thermoplasmata archaeon]